MRFVVNSLLLAFLFVVSIIIPLEVAERHFASQPQFNPADRRPADSSSVFDENKPGVPLYQYDLYPFTGGHTQANFTTNGGIFRTGKHGFMVEIDIDSPPPKKAGEVRILLVGGSAAAGHGGTRNELLIHNVMARYFTKKNFCAERASMLSICLWEEAEAIRILLL